MMVACRRTLTAAVLCVAILGRSVPTSAQPSPSPTLPSEVVEFITRRISCNDWIDKSHAGTRTAAEVDRMMDDWRCDRLGPDELALRDRYKADREVTDALDSTWIKIVRRVPVHVETTGR